MSRATLKDEIQQLNVAERILLAEEIWDSIARDQKKLPLTGAQRAELDRRLARHVRSPKEGASWEKVKNRIRSAR